MSGRLIGQTRWLLSMPVWPCLCGRLRQVVRQRGGDKKEAKAAAKAAELAATKTASDMRERETSKAVAGKAAENERLKAAIIKESTSGRTDESTLPPSPPGGSPVGATSASPA